MRIAFRSWLRTQLKLTIKSNREGVGSDSSATSEQSQIWEQDFMEEGKDNICSQNPALNNV